MSEIGSSTVSVHSGVSAAGGASGPSGASVPFDGAAQKVAFQHRTFSDFCALVGRLFYDDASIVLIDFLVREQRAYTEADIRERLRWKDNLLHQKLYFLERQLLVQREQNFEKGNKSPTYWRINPHIVLAVDWHYSKLLSELGKQVEASHRLHEFECTSCQRKYSALDAASGERALDDEHPLCALCGERLSISNSEEAKSEVKDKQERAMRQLSGLRGALDRVRNMQVPAFETYTRADKNEQKREMEEKFKAEAKQQNTAALSSLSVGATPTSAPSQASSHAVGVARPVAKGVPRPAGVPGSAQQHAQWLSITQTPAKSAQPKVPGETPTRVIPWFEQPSVPTANRGIGAPQQKPPVPVKNFAAQNPHSVRLPMSFSMRPGAASVAGAVQQRPHAGTAPWQQASLGLGGQAASLPPRSGVVDLRHSQTSVNATSNSNFATTASAVTARPPVRPGQTNGHLQTAQSVMATGNLQSARKRPYPETASHDSSGLLALSTLASLTPSSKKRQKGESEVEVAGVRLKVSEITREHEDRMTDTEYIRYCELNDGQ